MITIGYISDNVFYRLNLQTMQTEIHHHSEGRSYQAFTSNFKRQLVVLVEYGKNPKFSFEYQSQAKQSFDMTDVCELEVTQVQLSLDGRYLAVVCGIPEPKLIIIDIEQRRVLPGSSNSVQLTERLSDLKNIAFNPSNSKQIALQFSKCIELYELKSCFELCQSEEIEEAVSIRKIDTLEDECIELFIWDEINNLYISNKKQIYLYSTDTKSKVLACEIELEDVDYDLGVVKNIILTRKHIIVFYRHGRIEWLNKYYPDAMEEEEISLRPFYLDKYFETEREISYSSYDGQFSKILITFSEACFGILPKAAESNEVDEEEEEQQPQNAEEDKQKSRRLDIEVTYSHHYHASPIVLIHEYPSTAVCMTLSTVGRLIFWSIKNKKQIETHAISGDITCASINPSGNVMATGHSNGVVRFYSIAKPEDIFLFRELKMTKQGPIDQVSFSTNGEQLAVFSRLQKRLFYILTTLSMNFEILGFVSLPQDARSISWSGTIKSQIPARFEYVLVAAGHAFLMVNGPVAVATKKRGKELELKSEIYAARTDLEQNLLCGLPSGEIISTGADLLWKKYKQPEDLHEKIDFKSKVPPAAPLDEIEGHDFQTVLFRHSENFLISGGKEGCIQIRDYNRLKDVRQIRAFGWRNRSLSCVSGSWVRGIVYVAGKDGSLYVWKHEECEAKGDSTVNLAVPNFKKIESQEGNIKYFEVLIEEEYLERMKETIGEKKKVQFQKLDKIRSELKDLLEENQRHEELERLTRDEFAIDLETRDKLIKTGQQECQKIEEQSKQKILYSEVYAKRLKEITWDRMDVHLSAINGLKNHYIVYNYQLKKISAVEKRKVKLILELRRSQKREQKKSIAHGNEVDIPENKNVVNGGISTPLVMTQLQSMKKEDKKEDKKKKKEDEVQGQNENVEEAPPEQEWGLLYSSFELFNNNSKRNQIIMMKNIINIAKKTFNKEYNKLAKLRQNQNELIKDKNKRIIEICEELKRPIEVVTSKENILENNDGILTVHNSEIPFERYLSRDEREKLEKERLKEEERLRKLAEDDSAQRALQKMMGGTLEEKKVSALQIHVEKQKWMEKPIEEMNEDEKAKLKEYEQKRQKAEEEKERIVKKLEAELRKLKQEIDEVMEKYDEKLFELLKRRIEYDYRIEEQQLYCARLALSMINEEEEGKRHKLLKQQVVESRDKLQRLDRAKEQLGNHQSEFDDQREHKRQAIEKERLGEYESKIKTIEKSVFEEYHTNVKRRREMTEKILESNPHLKSQIINLDPMVEVETKNLNAEIATDYAYFISEIKNLQRTFQIPENTIERILENRFNIRKQEHELQEKQKVLSASVNNMEAQVQETQEKVQRQEEQIVQIEEFLQQCKSDLDIQIRIKQGQVEINNEKPIPHLDDALLLTKSEIDDKNFKIKKEAQEKIAVMKEIKACKIKVTEESLNLEKKQEHIDQLNSMIKEIQMLKVKKEMQLALSKKDTKINENELRSLKEQIEKVRKEGEKRIALYEDKIKKIYKEIETIKKENKQLETQKWNLEGTVKQREKIKDMMCGDSEGGEEAAEKFDQISVNRKLFDKAKQQTEQIELLRQELSKLKAKTFANFSNVQR